MPVKMFPDGLQPADQEAVIWRFMDLRKFRDLITKSELYFRRADLFDDDDEGLFDDDDAGLLPEDYLPHADLDPRDIHNGRQLNHFIGR